MKAGNKRRSKLPWKKELIVGAWMPKAFVTSHFNRMITVILWYNVYILMCVISFEMTMPSSMWGLNGLKFVNNMNYSLLSHQISTQMNPFGRFQTCVLTNIKSPNEEISFGRMAFHPSTRFHVTWRTNYFFRLWLYTSRTFGSVIPQDLDNHWMLKINSIGVFHS